MKINHLLDTHTLIWFIEGDENLSDIARKSIERRKITNYVSIASLWEIAIKINIGRLEIKVPFHQIREKIFENGFQILPISFEDTLIISSLPLFHRDPFDRIIIAQAMANNLTIISRDEHLRAYDIKQVW
ncbi:type II toxin-antitoxin system VapC family toxin [Dyadobacter bucti]|uniref:type II toxin-antitoxin system VapC family toxin n=1 Tax=Dyadobacter bucti TaxID=2572203 RepID=UPI00197A9BB6|nr:type II toxin-antitoxin system VapC family toxin [Dyadobacter bucti]